MVEVNVNGLANALAWVVLLIYFSGIIPQIILNHKLKSGKGISELMLFGFFTGYLAETIYAFCYYLPVAYKIMTPISTFAISILVFQRFYYGNFVEDKRKITFYISIFGMWIITLIYATTNTHTIGLACGWLSACIWAIYQIPQLLKIHTNKTTKGFSFMLITITSLGCFLELIISLILGLPKPTVFNGFKGIITYVLFCILYWKYSE